MTFERLAVAPSVISLVLGVTAVAQDADIAVFDVQASVGGNQVHLEQVGVTINGQPWTGDEANDFANLSSRERLATSIRLKLPPSPTVEVVLRVADSFGVEAVASQRVQRAQNMKTNHGRLFVLAVGVSNHRYEEYDLVYAAKDAKAIADFFDTQEGFTYGRVLRQTYLDGSETIDNILNGLKWLEDNCSEQDLAIVMFAGHAIRGRAGLYYVTHEGDGPSIANTCLRWEHVANSLISTKAKQIIFLSDVCHAGEFGQLRLQMQEEVIQALKNVRNLVAFTSSSGKESSFEHERWGHGAFTKALLTGLSGAADANANRDISIRELVDYVKPTVARLTFDAQHPDVTSFSEYDHELVLAKVPDDSKLVPQSLTEDATRPDAVRRSDLFTVGALWKGHFQMRVPKKGQRVQQTWQIVSRSGQRFEGTMYQEPYDPRDPKGAPIEGLIKGNEVTWNMGFNKKLGLPTAVFARSFLARHLREPIG